MKTATEPADLSALEQALGHSFRNRDLLVQATTHSAVGYGRTDTVHNERLEFLGDRVLGLVMAQFLMETFPKAKEGELGPRQSTLVSRPALAEVARAINLGAYLVLTAADDAGGKRNNDKLLADATEAVIAAVYLDGGLPVAERFIRKSWADQVSAVEEMPVEPKTALQVWALGRGKPLPSYSVVRSAGAAHDPVFEVRVEVKGVEPAQAEGSSKRAAEKAAALTMLKRLGVVPAEAQP
ncbi:MAG TPA: ribonuclease III [Alphaproteobacteria bacterium]|nr:ribonuclease III [Alphaproteobacteria bacterium]